MSIPISGQDLIQGSLLLLAVGLLGIFLFFIRFLNKTKRRARGERVKRRGFVAGILELMFLTLLAVAGSLGISLAAIQQTYRAFTERQLVARIQALPLDAAEKRMRLILVLQPDSPERQEYNYVLVGDEWAIEANIVTWDDWLTLYGFRPAYKLTRLRGRFTSLSEEKQRQPSVYALGDESFEQRWAWVLRFAPRMPGIRTAHGQTVFTYPAVNKIFNLRISHDGFTLEESRDQSLR